ncbi:hypothetical protein GCM10025331_53830 [Actinoplanes utahensis]|nr:hypothetical protein Aut01nite_61430 [Actinoplanes utahensis]
MQNAVRHHDGPRFLYAVPGPEEIVNVVVQSSANPTVTNGSNMWRNAVTFAGDTSLYDAYYEYHKDLGGDQAKTEFHPPGRRRRAACPPGQEVLGRRDLHRGRRGRACVAAEPLADRAVPDAGGRR